MTLSPESRIRLRAASAVLTRNRRELESAIALPEDTIGPGLYAEVRRILGVAPVPENYFLVNFANRLPAIIQYVGQRTVLLFPRIAHRLLRSSGLHHQMY